MTWSSAESGAARLGMNSACRLLVTSEQVSLSRPASEPTAHERYSLSVAWFDSRTAWVRASSSALIAAPASASFTGEAPPRPSEPRA